MSGIPGRDQIAAQLAGAWGDACAGVGSVLVVQGEAGMGKSTLLGWLVEHVGAAARHVVCRGGVLRSPMDVADEVAAALHADGPPRNRPATEVDPIAVAGLLLELLQDGGAQEPMALLVDDLHEMDPASRTALNLALRRLTPLRLLVVLTGRPTDAVRTFAEGFPVLVLPPLAPVDARALLERSSPVPIEPAVGERLLELAGGNPLALTRLPLALEEELLRGQRILPDPIPVAGDLRTAFTRPLADLTAPARTLLDIAAVSSDGSWPAVLRALDGDPEPALSELEAAGLADLHAGRVVFQHPVLRAAVVAELPRKLWRQINRRLAEVDALPEEVRLLHRARGTVGPDEDLVDELVAVSAEVRVRGGAEAAARVLDEALGLTGDGGRRAQLHVEAADVLALAGAAAPARRRLRAVLDDDTTTTPEVVVGASRRLARLEALNGDPFGAWTRLQDCAAQAPTADLAPIHTEMALPLGMLGFAREIISQAETALALAPPGSPTWQVASIVHAHAVAATDEAAAVLSIRAVLPDLDLGAAASLDPTFGLHIGRALSIAEMLSEAEGHLTRLITRSRAEGARVALAMSHGAFGEVHIRSSRFDEAQTCLDEAIALSMTTGQRAFTPFWHALRARVHAVRGDEEAAEADLATGLRIAEQLSLMGARYFLKAGAGLAAASRADHHAVVEHLEECRFFEDAGGVMSPNLARWRPDLVDAYVALGRIDDAHAVLEPVRALADLPRVSRWTRATVLRSSGRLAAGEDPRGAVRMLRQAVATYDPVIDRFDLGRARLTLAEILTASGDLAAAGQAVAEARIDFRMVGAAPWSAALDAVSGTPAPVARDPADVLSEAELRVLAEVSRGLTNHQIATRLAVSPKTVANHLYRTYRKLGVASRTEAAGRYLTR